MNHQLICPNPSCQATNSFDYLPEDGAGIMCHRCAIPFKLITVFGLRSTAKMDDTAENAEVFISKHIAENARPVSLLDILFRAANGERQKGERIEQEECDCLDCQSERMTAARANESIGRQMKDAHAGVDVVDDRHPLTVPGILREAASTYEDRNPAYGNTYKNIGPVMAALFPDGLTLRTPEDWARFGVYFMAVGKLARYAPNLKAGGHYDSALDGSVYCAMLAELTMDGGR